MCIRDRSIVAYKVGGGDLTAAATGLGAWEGILQSGYDTVPYGATTATISIYTYGAGTVDFRQVGLVLE